MQEVLMPIANWPRYYISNLGKVYSMKTADGSLRELKPFTNGKGYQYVTLSDPHKDKCNARIHRLVAEAFCANYTPECDVHHKDRNRANNQYDNLVCLSQQEHQKLHKLEAMTYDC